MEFLLSLPKSLLDLALGLLKIKRDDRTRQRLADLLCSVADCVSSIGDSIEARVHSTERCAELHAYILNLHRLVAEETDEATANKLTFWLKHVADVPGVAKIDFGKIIETQTAPAWRKSRRFEQTESIKQVAGMIRGIGNLVRV